MFELLGITPQALVAQLLIGLINGSFYAMLSLGLAVIFGLLNVINFTCTETTWRPGAPEPGGLSKKS